MMSCIRWLSDVQNAAKICVIEGSAQNLVEYMDGSVWNVTFFYP